MDKIAIIGGSGTALNVAEAIAEAIRHHGLKAQLAGFINDELEKLRKIGGFPIIGTLPQIPRLLSDPDLKILYLLYKPEKMTERASLLRSLHIPVDRLYTYIDPRSHVSLSAVLGPGCVVLPGAVICANVSAGIGNVICSNAVVEHDTSLEDSNFVAAGAAIGSHVTIGNANFFGLNSSVREHCRIADGNMLGMSAALLADMAGNEIRAGNPARLIRSSGHD